MSKTSEKTSSSHVGKITKKTKKELTWRRLGYLQLSLLLAVWQTAMYGLEIKRHLTLTGYNIKENQLYPALKRLVESGVLESHEKEIKGANRKYFKTTKQGRILIGQYINNFYGLFSEIMAFKVDFVRDEIFEYLNISPGMLIADFSRRYGATQFRPMAELSRNIGPTGRLFLLNFAGGEYNKIFRERIRIHKVEDTITLLDVDKGKTILPDNSLDYCLSIFSLQFVGMGWVIPEVARVLKPKGRIVVASSIDREESDFRSAFNDVLMDISREAYPEVGKIGVNSDEIQNKFADHGLSVLKRKEKNGVVYFLFEKNDLLID